jgi:hypothetical protein
MRLVKMFLVFKKHWENNKNRKQEELLEDLNEIWKILKKKNIERIKRDEFLEDFKLYKRE